MRDKHTEQRKYIEQLKFVKALAARLPDNAPCVSWYRESDDEPLKQQTLDDIKRLRRELNDLAHIVERL